MTNYLKRGVDWGNLPDSTLREVWDKLNGNFWLPEAVSLSSDFTSWRAMKPEERLAITRVFAGLTLLDTIQGTVGAPAIARDSRSLHEEAIFSQIAYMENVHAQSYSYIFQTLNSSAEIEDAFQWSESNEYLQNKARIFMEYYQNSDEHKRKIASTMLESMSFYSGFFLPLYYSSRGKIVGVSEVISLIIRDESLHGWFIGYLYQQRIPGDRREELEDFTYDLLSDLVSNEIKYTQDLYDPIGLTEEVVKFIRYNGNKTLMNLGYDPIYSKEQTGVSPEVLTGLSLESTNSDFFSTTVTSYKQGKTEETDDDDWDF